MIWSDAESLPRERLAARQLERLRATVERILARVPPLAERLRAAGIDAAAEIGSLDDLARLPFTVKADLRQHYPLGLLAVPRAEVARIHASSGTRGKATVVAYTRADLVTWAEVMARTFALGGVRPGMVVQNSYGYGLFTGGLGFHQGAELLGCTVVPISGGATGRQITMMRDLGAEVLCATPSYALHLAGALAEAGLRPDEVRLEVGLFGAEPWTEPMRAAIEAGLGLRAINCYGLSEIVGPGVAAECAEARAGAHIQEDHFLAEVVDPASGQPLPPGQEGELVLTTLTKEAMPLLRYRTGDLTALDPSPCPCGRTTARMARVRGRIDDMLIVRGVNLYPSEVERVLLGLAGAGPHYQIVVERPAALDEMTVLCEPADRAVDREALRARAERALREETGLGVVVRVVEIGALPRSEGKAARVDDRR